MPIDQRINYLELPARDFDAVRRFHFADPHGNELAVWSG